MPTLTLHRMRPDPGLMAVAVIAFATIAAFGRDTSAAEVLGNSLGARFGVAARQACDERGAAEHCGVTEITREQLTDDVAHYRVLLQVGAGPYDYLAIHRIIRERQKGVPVHTEGAFFYVHGSTGQFFYSMISGGSAGAAGVYLAQRNIDVWGLDVRWVQVPREETNFAFMKDWNFGTQVADIMLALRLARHMRRLTGQSFGLLNLAGHSLGASLVYAVANAEAAVPDDQRDISGLIPMDTAYPLPPTSTATRSLFCGIEASYRIALAAGSYNLNSLGAIDAGTRALLDPGGISPVPTLTNGQFALNMAAALTFLPALPYYHNYSVIRDEAGRPVEGRYTQAPTIFEKMAHSVPWRARATMIDYMALACGQTDVPYDDHLSEITIPILYIGFAGGFGEEGLYTTQLLGSQDITTLIIQLQPPGNGADDFAHIDWLGADDAPTLVWEPIRSWLVAH